MRKFNNRITLTNTSDLQEDFDPDSRIFENIADAVPDMLYVTDIQQMRKIYSNHRIHCLFSMNRREISEMGRQFFEKIVHPDDKARYFDSIEQLKAASDQDITELQYRIIDSSGKIHWLVTKRKIVKRDEEGNPLHILGISQDVTEQVNLLEEKQRLLDEQMKLKAEQQRRLLKAIIHAQEEERRNIAENLHNEIGQLLFAAQLKLSADAEESRMLLNKAIQKVRQISFELTPVLLTDMGLEIALRDMLERKLSNLKMSFNFSYQVRETQFTSNIEIVIYRIVQELLNNTIKHAEAGHVNVSVQQKENELYLTYTDDGKGMNRDMLSDNGKGFGLKSITNRLHTLNGVMEILSEPAKGTKVFMNIPLYATD